jgi:hypothetical protein
MKYPSVRSVFKKWCREVRASKEPRQINPTITITDPRAIDVPSEKLCAFEVTFKLTEKDK